jgi:hypothetical protein
VRDKFSMYTLGNSSFLCHLYRDSLINKLRFIFKILTSLTITQLILVRLHSMSIPTLALHL